MFSFIIIGRNEGWRLTKCIQSTFDTIKNNNLEKYEIIYIDSRSTDDSVSRAKSFNKLKVIQLTGIYNAAVARNVGVKESSGDVLFFIDADMELQLDFLKYVYNKNKGLIYPFVSGQLKNFNYDENDNFLYSSWQYNKVIKSDIYDTTTGGIFIIQRSLWEKIGGMDNRFRRGQDLELALRLAQKGTKILRKKEIIAYHHTISYTHHTRIWKTIFSGDISYSNSFLFRKHIFNPFIFPKILKQYYTLLSLLSFLGISFIFKNYFFLLLYFIVVVIKTKPPNKSNIGRKVELYTYYIVRDLTFIYFLCIPLKKITSKGIHYKII